MSERSPSGVLSDWGGECKVLNFKQKCEGVIWQWEQDKVQDGLSVPQGDLAGIRTEMREFKEVMNEGVKAITTLTRVVDVGLWQIRNIAISSYKSDGEERDLYTRFAMELNEELEDNINGLWKEPMEVVRGMAVDRC